MTSTPPARIGAPAQAPAAGTGTEPGAFDARRFAELFRTHPAGVTIVTGTPGDGPIGLTATSVTFVSKTPPVLVLSLADESATARLLATCGSLAFHFLDASERRLAELFASPGADRFDGTTAWTTLPTGEPLLTGVGRWIRGRITARTRAGAATLLVVEATAVGASAPGESPLVYHRRSWHLLDSRSRIAGRRTAEQRPAERRLTAQELAGAPA